MNRVLFWAALFLAAFAMTPASFAQRVRARISPPLAAPAVPGAGIWARPIAPAVPRAGIVVNTPNFSLGVNVPARGYFYNPGFSYFGGLGFGYEFGNPYGIYYNPGASYLDYYLPPIYAPAELAYGPQAMQRFVGPPAVDPFGGIPGGLVAPLEEKPADARPAVRVSNLEARRRALRFVEAGDELFRSQRYHEALQKYKSAAEAAPDVAESYLRQGFALLATARYDMAAAAFKRGLVLEPEWAAADFRLESIYDGAIWAKDSHVEHLANTLLERPADADLLFVLAMFLQYDGDRERASRFFQRAAELSRKDAPHLRPFLKTEEEAAEPALKLGPRKPEPPAEPPGIDV